MLMVIPNPEKRQVPCSRLVLCTTQVIQRTSFRENYPLGYKSSLNFIKTCKEILIPVGHENFLENHNLIQVNPKDPRAMVDIYI